MCKNFKKLNLDFNTVWKSINRFVLVWKLMPSDGVTHLHIFVWRDPLWKGCNLLVRILSHLRFYNNIKKIIWIWPCPCVNFSEMCQYILHIIFFSSHLHHKYFLKRMDQEWKGLWVLIFNAFCYGKVTSASNIYDCKIVWEYSK